MSGSTTAGVGGGWGAAGVGAQAGGGGRGSTLGTAGRGGAAGSPPHPTIDAGIVRKIDADSGCGVTYPPTGFLGANVLSLDRASLASGGPPYELAVDLTQDASLTITMTLLYGSGWGLGVNGGWLFSNWVGERQQFLARASGRDELSFRSKRGRGEPRLLRMRLTDTDANEDHRLATLVRRFEQEFGHLLGRSQEPKSVRVYERTGLEQSRRVAMTKTLV